MEVYTILQSIFIFLVFLHVIIYVKREIKTRILREEILNYMKEHYEMDYRENTIIGVGASQYRHSGRYYNLLENRVKNDSKFLPNDEFLNPRYEKLKKLIDFRFKHYFFIIVTVIYRLTLVFTRFLF